MKNLLGKKIGIIGGMGPMATLDLYSWIVKLTPATKDQEHLPVIISSSPQIPDRTDYLLGKGEDPLPHLIKIAEMLEEDGAEILAIPCNTAHAFVDDIQKDLKKAKVINMLEITRDTLKSKIFDKNLKVGLLATTGSIKSGIFHKYFSDFNLIIPSEDVQKKVVMEAIYGNKGIKKGYKITGRNLLKKAVKHLQSNGANIIILGCTEVSMVFRNERNNGVIYVNPVKILANHLVKESTKND